VARLALILAILALAVAWAAYRREGGELRTLWQDLTRGAEGQVHITSDSDGDLRTWLAETQARLEKRRPEVAGERNLQEVRDDVAKTRENLKRAYRDAGAGAKERWKSLDGDLERLQSQLKEGGSKALATLDSALAKIKQEAGRAEEH
jgi:multidrug resistance efflux pump